MQQKAINEKYQRIHESKQLLKATDYHITKAEDTKIMAERGMSSEVYAIPDLILLERANARSEINRLESEIEILEEELRNHMDVIDEIEL